MNAEADGAVVFRQPPMPSGGRPATREQMPALAWLGVLPGVVVLGATTGRAPGMTWDSVQYCAAAVSAASRGVLAAPLAPSIGQQFDASGRLLPWHPLVLWPPGYPLAIALIARTSGASILACIAATNVAALAVFLAAVAWTARRAAGPAAGACIAGVVGVLPVVQSVFRMAWSESVFLAACGVAIAALTAWVGAPARRVRLSAAAAAAGAAAVHVRYTGVFVLMLHALCAAWVLLRTRAARARWMPIVCSVILGPLLGSAFLLVRLRTLGCAMCEPRLPSSLTFRATALDFLRAAAASLPAVHELLPGPLDALGSLALVAAVVLIFRGRGGEPARARQRKRACWIAGLFGSIYATGMVGLRSLVEFNALDTRLIAPASCAWLAIAVAAALLRIRPAARARVSLAAIVLFGAADLVGARRVAWRGLTDRRVRDSELVQYAVDQRRRHPDAVLFTNAASFVYPHLGCDGPVYWLPERGIPQVRDTEATVVLDLAADRDPSRIRALDAAGTRIARGDGFVAWRLPATPPTPTPTRTASGLGPRRE